VGYNNTVGEKVEVHGLRGAISEKRDERKKGVGVLR
jgi:hypothetical protein